MMANPVSPNEDDAEAHFLHDEYEYFKWTPNEAALAA